MIRYEPSTTYQLFGLNTSTGLFSLSFLFALIFLLLHKLGWPVASRLLYPIARFNIVRNRKAMVALGIVCSAVILPPFGDLIKKISELFH